uniref:Meckel syndrome type 1 protein n=2 Tax=Timema TaxID=61471 RepID=A0A7R9JYS3_TIMGE|nr:unnamed protein product [Timema genevievae]
MKHHHFDREPECSLYRLGAGALSSALMDKSSERDSSGLWTHFCGYKQASCEQKLNTRLPPSTDDVILPGLPMEEEVGRSEYILCTLCWDLDINVLTVTPDFSSSPYIVETDGDSRNLYLYWLEHTSESITAEARTSEAAIINKLSSYQTDIRQQQVSLQFDTPHHGALLTFIAGEIVSAKHFEADNLFVHYLIELPEGWSCKSPQYLSGVTQTCNTHRRGVAHFGYLFQLSLISNVDMLNLETDSLPHLYIEVLSCDWWGCTTSEGYGCISLPCVYGQHDVRVPTWRPVPVSIVAQMRRHFLGGSPELVNLTHCGVPSDSQNKVVSKYGLPTVTSGELDLRLNIVRQSQALSPAKGKPSGGGDAMLLERLSTATLVSTVNNVLVAFRRARERMMRARQGL